jgi:hypothetical protein
MHIYMACRIPPTLFIESSAAMISARSNTSNAEMEVNAIFGKRLAAKYPQLLKLRREYYGNYTRSISKAVSRTNMKATRDAYLSCRRSYNDIAYQRKVASRLVRKLELPLDLPMLISEWCTDGFLKVLMKTNFRPYTGPVYADADIAIDTIDTARSILEKASIEELVDNFLSFKFFIIRTSEEDNRADELLDVCFFGDGDANDEDVIENGDDETTDGLCTIHRWDIMLKVARELLLREVKGSKDIIIDAIINLKTHVLVIGDDDEISKIFQDIIEESDDPDDSDDEE